MTPLPEPTFIKYFYRIIESCDDCPHSTKLKEIRSSSIWVACLHPEIGKTFVGIIPFGEVRINHIPEWCPLPKKREEIE